MTRWHPGMILIGLVGLLPLVAVVPLASSIPRIAVTASPVYLYTVGLLLAFAAWIGTQDRWLGALAAWASLALFWNPTVGAFEAAETLVMSLMALSLLRLMPEHVHPFAVKILVGVGLFEVADGIQQWFGYDVLWNGFRPIPALPAVYGTTGNSNYYGVMLAMIAPLAPWWAVPCFLFGIYLSHCLLASLAVSVALIWRARQDVMRLDLAIGIGLLLVASIFYMKGGRALSGFYHRLAVWLLAWENLSWPGVLLGVGPGSWAELIPKLQIERGVYAHEVFMQAHSEWLQLLFEHGAFAVGLVLGWLWSQRALLQGPFGPAVLSVALCAVAMFPLHLAMTGCVALVILGLSTSMKEAS